MAAAFGEGDREALRKWMERGGMVVRFAGEKLASEPNDDLLPVRIRAGDRTLGGALSWTEPARLAAFDEVFPQKSTTSARLELVQRLRRLGSREPTD